MTSDYNSRKKRREQREDFVSSLFRLLVILLIPVYIVLMLRDIREKNAREQEKAQVESSAEEENTGEGTESSQITATEPQTPETGNFLTFENLTEGDVYTFLQGPKAWESKADWSGAWCEEILGGQKFSIFGCGLCDIANIYSTLTPYDCSPVDMFYYAEEVTEYSPTANYGAIAWEYMREALRTTGIYSRLMKKDDTYEAFQQNIQNGITAIVLVNSGDDSTYWQNTTGHYVNIWLYNSSDDTVFLADSGNPDHNRQRIPLRYVYDALKVSDNWQYLLIESVNADGNQWQHDGIDDEWNSPWV